MTLSIPVIFKKSIFDLYNLKTPEIVFAYSNTDQFTNLSVNKPTSFFHTKKNFAIKK